MFIAVLDVRRIGNNHIVSAFRRPVGIKPRTLRKLDFCAQFGRILTGSIQSTNADVGCANISINAFKRDGHGNGAAARSQIPHAALRRQAFEHGFHQMLGFRTWNQHMRIDGKASSVKLAFAQQIGHRLAFQTALRQSLQGLQGRFCQIVRTACNQLRARVTQRILQQHPRFIFGQCRLAQPFIKRHFSSHLPALRLFFPYSFRQTCRWWQQQMRHTTNKILHRNARYPPYFLLHRRVRLSH